MATARLEAVEDAVRVLVRVLHPEQVYLVGSTARGEDRAGSDIDLVVFYDADRFPFAKRGDARGAAVDIVRGLVKLIAETTAGGYVFRTDLRLRPDAGATQVAAEGIPTLVLGIPLRYMHTPVELVAIKDIQRAGRLLAEFIAGLGPDFMEKIVWD